MAMIMVIDDSPTRSLVLSRWLQQLGHGLQCHASVQALLAKADPAKVELVLLALVMDDGNGFDSGLVLQQRGFSPVLLLADIDRATDAIWARAQGLAGVVSWPLTQASLGRAVDDVLAACREHAHE